MTTIAAATSADLPALLELLGQSALPRPGSQITSTRRSWPTRQATSSAAPPSSCTALRRCSAQWRSRPDCVAGGWARSSPATHSRSRAAARSGRCTCSRKRLEGSSRASGSGPSPATRWTPPCSDRWSSRALVRRARSRWRRSWSVALVLEPRLFREGPHDLLLLRREPVRDLDPHFHVLIAATAVLLDALARDAEPLPVRRAGRHLQQDVTPLQRAHLDLRAE